MSYIFVAGSHRGGTSLTCQVLHALGVDFGGRLAGPGKANPYGFYEHLRMRTGVVKPWLRRIGADPMGQGPLPPRDWRPTPKQAQRFRADVTNTLGRAQAHKDAKTLPLWPLFHAAFPDARWVAVRRDPDAIADSCMRTTFMVRYRTHRDWLVWALDQHDRLDDLMAETNAVEVWPDPEDVRSFRPLTALGLEWRPARVQRVLHPEAWGRARVAT